MRTLYLLIGNIGSGKSTWARKFVAENPNTKIVCADSFRTMFNGVYKYEAEVDGIIDLCMIAAINLLLRNGWNVIVDTCNFTNQRRKTWLHCGEDKRVAVMFPTKSREWHVANRLKNNHKDGTDCGRIYDDNVAAFESVDKSQFDKIIQVKE